VGTELPLLVRMLNRYGELRRIVAQALSFDYLGCLAGSILFPLVLLPAVGLMRTAFLVGLVNLGVAFYALRVFRPRFRGVAAPAVCAGAAIVLALGFAQSLRLHGLLERQLYEDEVVHAEQSRYQRIVLTRWRDDLRLFIDGNIQFSSVDEHRYHETLVHPALGLAASRAEVLVLGGGDGLAVREVLRHPEVRAVTVVDLDPAMTRLGRDYPALRALNGAALSDPRVHVLNQDAHRFLETTTGRYGAILADLPDPNGDALAKLYSVEFYRLARRHLSPGGVFVTQATSPFFSRDAFWCVVRSVRAAGLRPLPIHVYVPSFGDWGFVLAAERELRLEGLRLPGSLRFLTPDLAPALAVFDGDTGEVSVEVSTVDHPRILRYYGDSARKWD
jgi:spermidine synthase